MVADSGWVRGINTPSLRVILKKKKKKKLLITIFTSETITSEHIINFFMIMGSILYSSLIYLIKSI